MKSLYALLTSLLMVCSVFAQHAQSGTSRGLTGIGYSLNEGQFPSEVQVFSPISGGYMYAEHDALLFSLFSTPEHGSRQGIMGHHVYRQQFLNAGSATADLPDETRLAWHRNFFLGQDTEAWRGGIAVHSNAFLSEIYPGIQLELTEEYGHFKTNFHVAPNANAALVRWNYDGAEARLENGHLIVDTSVGEMREMKPVAWTVNSDGSRNRVKVRYVQEENHFRFELGEYDETLPLVIDPVLVFSSYTGSTADNWGYTATFDLTEHAYGGGIVAGAGFPVTTGASQGSMGGGSWDVGLIKFLPDGTDIEYATYLGGDGNEVPSSMVVDHQNRLVVFGTTGSSDFPYTDGAWDDSHNGGPNEAPLGTVSFPNGADFYVSRLSPDGSVLDASTYIGGDGTDGINLEFDFNYGDLFRAEVIVDGQDRVICAGSTTSSDLPTAGTPYSDTNSGGQDAAFFMLEEDLSGLVWGTYFGGLLDDSAYALELMDDGAVYAVGSTQSLDVEMPEDAIYSDFQGDLDGYVVRVEDGQVVNSTFMGTSAYDRTFFIEKDTDGNLWITGQTEGDWPLINNTYTDEGAGQYFAKLNPELTEILLSTTFGFDGIFSPINICQTAFLVDECNRLFVAGWGGALNFTFGDTAGMPVSSDAFQSTTDGSDFYLAAFDVNVGGMLYGTFFGSDILSEHVDGGTSRFSPDGTVYQAVCAGCGGSSTFPVTDGAFSETNNASNCNLAVFKFDFEIQSLNAVASASPSEEGCTPFTVEFSNAGSSGVESYWDFGTGDTSTQDDPTYTYTEPGIFEVMYVSVDEGSCNISDTTYITLEVQDPLLLNPAFEWSAPLCQDSGLVTFNYTGGSEYDQLIWSLGDGLPESGTSFIHLYELPGTYTVTATVTDEFCDESETFTQEVFIDPQGGVEGELFWPNIFTPGNDAYNRQFQPYLELDNGLRLVPEAAEVSDLFESLELQVFNRWGNLVFESSEQTPFWDAEGAAEGVYYYIGEHQLRCTDTEVTRLPGYVHVVR